MSRPSRSKAPKPAAQAAAKPPAPEMEFGAGAGPTMPPADQVLAGSGGGGGPTAATTDQAKTESTLGDGDATGAGAAAPSAIAAPEAPAPNVGTDDGEDHSQKCGPEGYAVLVTGPAKGRWRIGRKFGPEPVSIPAQELTEPQLRALDEDPELTIQLVEIED